MKKNKNDNIKKLNWNKRVLFFDFTILLTTILYFILNALGGQYIILDAFGTATCIIGFILIQKKYIEAWLIWSFCNIFTLLIWIFNTINNLNNLPFLFLYLIYLCNGIIAFIVWNIKYNKQKYLTKNSD